MDTQATFHGLENEAFVVLTTYRRSGEPIPTTIWFAQDGPRLYMTTAREAGKAKRIRNNPAATVAASDQVGNIHGPAQHGNARILQPEEYPLAIDALRRKYGSMYDQMTEQMDATRPAGSRIFLVVEAVQAM